MTAALCFIALAVACVVGWLWLDHVRYRRAMPRNLENALRRAIGERPKKW